ncbi:MAG: metal ABC transporter permease [Bacilli bacterium]|nr:metal ABC transporter permease [Bacilli bacterium]
MMSNIIEMFSYSFMIKALIVGVLISLCASLIGVSTVLRKNSMIGDGLSHVAFMTFALATILHVAPLYFSIPIVVIVSFLILRLNTNNKVHGDSMIALVSASSLAIGTFLISITKGVNIDINNYLFGSILGVDTIDVIVSIILTVVVLFLYLVFYNKIFAITFDETFSKSIGIKTNVYNAIFAILCSLVVVVGMRLMGSLLISSLIIFPALISMQLFKKFKSVVISSVIISILTFIIGLILSYVFSTPTGATVVIVNIILFIVVKIISMIK